MIRPPYSLLQHNYPAPGSVTTEGLYQSIGHADKAKERGWENTCAIRVSLALLGAGVPIPSGFLRIEDGKFKGKRAEINVVKLSSHLAGWWGEPEMFSGALAQEQIGRRKGLIRFIQLWGPFDPQGHIDLVSPADWTRLACQGTCYWHAVEVWFWELP